MLVRVLTRCATLLLLPSFVVAQTTQPTETRPSVLRLTFDWQPGATATVSSTSQRDERSFTLEYDLVVRGDETGQLSIGRRDVRVTHWNGRDLPSEHRPKVRPLELNVESAPDVLVDDSGTCRGVEAEEGWQKRVRGLASDALQNGAISAEAAAELESIADSPRQFALLEHQAKQGWDDWVGRWITIPFGADVEPFDGEIELASGDVVDGVFTASHTSENDGKVRLRVDFRAGGPKLDAAALSWRQRLFGGGQETFEPVSMTVEESAEVLTDPKTLIPVEARTHRKTVVTVGEESRTFEESQTWRFRWK